MAALYLATRCGDDAFEALAQFWFGFIYHLLGEPRKADGYLEWVLVRHTPGRWWTELRALVGFDLLPHLLTISAINKLSLGYPDEALARSARAVTTAQDLGDQYGLAFASAIGSMTLFLLRGDPRALQERSELCCRHCEKHGFAWWQYRRRQDCPNGWRDKRLDDRAALDASDELWLSANRTKYPQGDSYSGWWADHEQHSGTDPWHRGGA